MDKLVRFGVSLERSLLQSFDKHIMSKNYSNRSEAIRDLIREDFVKIEWQEDKEVAGTITLVYNHHQRELVNRLTEIQHMHHALIISSHHVHLDHHNCLESVVVKGKASKIRELADKLKSAKGVKFGDLTMATTGKELK
ncbi:MAG: nickel-responsive transcriptional regulator NikR [Candidatus Omnitrophica bacterium]|nr:nickel-responsive transcriptional regulator NikR [Candidatus Omnitrophota bacterium]